MAKINTKNILYHKFIKSRAECDLTAFKKYRNRLNTELKKARNAYYTNQFTSTCGRVDIMWKRLNAILGRNSKSGELNMLNIDGVSITGKELADTFNTHFICASRNQVPHNNLSDVVHISDTIFLKPVEEADVMTAFHELNNSTSIDIDGLQIKPIRYIFDLILPYITHILNLCVSTAVFPRKMQIARVTVIFKKGDKNQLGNYRPISILPVFSKLLEKVILRNFLQFEEKHKIITAAQYGFRKHRSTELALLDQREYILNELEHNRIVIGIFLDFSKAFDLLNHTILLRKLERCGFRGHALSLVQSYLMDRKQAVAINGLLSDMQSVGCGVPQGSILVHFCLIFTSMTLYMQLHSLNLSSMLTTPVFFLPEIMQPNSQILQTMH